LDELLISFSISSSIAVILEDMNESDDGRDCTREFWKLVISSQIAVIDTMASTLDSIPKEMQSNWLREMCKSNAAIFNMYFRTMEEASAQSIELQSAALRRCSETLRSVLSNMRGTTG
jgi:hypothetical protein